MNQLPDENWKNEFQAFMGVSGEIPPAHLTKIVRKGIHSEMNPASWKVFSKLFAIQFVASVFSYVLCLKLDFHTAFFKLGELGCLLCGGMFLGISGLLSAALLRGAEVNRIRNSRALQLAMLTFVSLGLYFSLEEKELLAPWTFLAAWIVGSLAGGYFSLEVGWRLRVALNKQLAR